MCPTARATAKVGNFVGGIEATLRELDHGVPAQRHRAGRRPRACRSTPTRHQAMVEIPTDEAEPGTIVEEMQAGYVLKDRLLRPALVGVAKAG